MIALVAAIAVVSTTSSLTWPILSERLRIQGYDESAIGFNAAAQFVGIIVVAFAAPRLIPRLGFFKTLLVGMVLAGSMLVLLPILRDYHAWLVLRFCLGIGNALLFTTGDTWVNQIVDDRVRGRWMGVYATVGIAGWAMGPLLGSALDPQSFWPFLIGIATIAVAASLLLPTRRLDVKLEAEPGMGSGAAMMAAFLAAPSVLLSSLMYGVVEGAMQSFAHLYTMDVLGEEFRRTGYAVIWVGAVGAVFFQYPVGVLADRIDRGWLLVTCVAVTALMALLLPVLIGAAAQPWWTPAALLLWGSLCVWGGGLGAIFTVGLALLGERFRGIALIAANAVFTLFFGLGGMLGPFLVGTAMDHFGPIGYPGTLFVIVSAYTIFAAYRRVAHPRHL